MPFFRKRTNMVRSAALPEFYSDDFCCGGAFDANYLGGYSFIYDSISLYNNASDGSLLYVYGIQSAQDAGYANDVWTIKGTVGSLSMNCRPVRFTLGNPFGQVYMLQTHDNLPLTNYPGPPAGATRLTTLAVGTDAALFAFTPYPQAIIDPGYSLGVSNIAPAANFQVSFWYCVAKAG